MTDNEIIAVFMGGYQIKPHGKYEFPNHPFKLTCYEREMEYHTSWDWLMPVFEKIEKTKVRSMKFQVKINIYRDSFCRIESSGKAFRNGIGNGDTLIQAAHLTAVEFIKWYNTQTPN